MATFKHLLGGNIQSKRVIVSDGYDAATPVTITIQQPANSQIVGGHYRQLQVATVANTGNVGIDVGVEGALTSIFSDTNNDSVADGVSGRARGGGYGDHAAAKTLQKGGVRRRFSVKYSQ